MHFDVKRLSETTGLKNNQCEVEQTKTIVCILNFIFEINYLYIVARWRANKIMNIFD